MDMTNVLSPSGFDQQRKQPIVADNSLAKGEEVGSHKVFSPTYSINALAEPFRPPKSPYQWSHIPCALVNLLRPTPQKSDVESIAGTLSSPVITFSQLEVRQVRRKSKVKIQAITLEDLYERRQLPPLTLRDFEDYLCFERKSAEALYFDLWMRSYQKLFAASTPSHRPYEHVVELTATYQMALTTFFDANSPLELNTSDELRTELDRSIAELSLKASRSPSIDSFSPPQSFAKIHSENHAILQELFRSFLLSRMGNAGSNRGMFAKVIGLLTYVLGWIPAILALTMHMSRTWRAIGIPFWFTGIMVFVGGLNRTCLLIYLFGDNRQLFPWELARAPFSCASSMPIPDPTTPTSLFSGPAVRDSMMSDRDAKSACSPIWEHSEEPVVVHIVALNHASRTSSVDKNGEKTSQEPRARPSSLGPRRDSVVSPFHFALSYFPVRVDSIDTLYFAPSYDAVKAFTNEKSSPTWASLTRVSSPLVLTQIRAHVIAAAGYGMVATLLTSAIVFAIPV